MSGITLAPAIAAAVGLLLASGGVEPRRRGVAFLLALVFGVSLGLAESTPLSLLARAIGALTLAHALGLDLRERMIDLRVLLGGLVAVLSVSMIDRTANGASPLEPLVAAFAAGTLALMMWLGGRLYARLRDLGLDPLTGERAEAFGSGDIPAWALVGATLGTPTLALGAFVAGTFAGALIGIALLLARGLTPASDEKGNAPDAAFIPLLPAIIVGSACLLLATR